MAATQETRYIQFPLYLLRDLFKDKKNTINNIFKYGIYNYATKIKCTLEGAAQQVVYDFYRGNLGVRIKNIIESISWEYLGQDDTYNGFSGDTFNPEDEIQELMEEFESNENLKELAIEHYQVHLAYESLRLTGNKLQTIIKGKDIMNKVPEKEPCPMINVSILLNVRDTEKSEFDLIQFAAYVGIRSILGQKQYVKTNKKHILSRMFGYSSQKDLPIKINKNPLFIKYSYRHHIDKTIRELEANWSVITYSRNMRGLYVAMKNKISLNDLAVIAESKKKSNIYSQIKNQKIEATKYALLKLKSS